MTFEEFFAKKKIDLAQLEKAEPALYREFKSHFELMGEKSFDHTKKFWFNKLRRSYHLDSPAKAITQIDTKIASQAELLTSPTIEQKILPETGEQKTTTTAPRFRPRNIPTKASEEKEEQQPETPEEIVAPVKKVGFRPRNIKSQENAAEANTPESEPGHQETSATPATDPKEAAKPGYKPKFKVRNIPKNSGGAAEQIHPATEQQAIPEVPAEAKSQESQEVPAASVEQQAKPAYKPKFKMKNLQSKPAEETTEAKGGLDDAEAPESNKEEINPPETAAKPAYKPRFNMKNIPPKSAEPESGSSEESPAQQNQESERESNSAGEGSKPAYKPRFNMRNIPQKSAEHDQGKKAEETSNQENSDAEEKIQDDKPAEEAPKPAYKPKFNMRNIKPKGDQ